MTGETVSVKFGCGRCECTFSLVVYPLPSGEFLFDNKYELATVATGTFGLGTHRLTVNDLFKTICRQPTMRWDQTYDNNGNSNVAADI